MSKRTMVLSAMFAALALPAIAAQQPLASQAVT
jgi:hypothetical protein